MEKFDLNVSIFVGHNKTNTSLRKQFFLFILFTIKLNAKSFEYVSFDNIYQYTFYKLNS